jgi:hypothetical protein
MECMLFLLFFWLGQGFILNHVLTVGYHGELTLAASLPQGPEWPGQCLPLRPDTKLQGAVTVSQLILGRLWAAFDPHIKTRISHIPFPEPLCLWLVLPAVTFHS